MCRGSYELAELAIGLAVSSCKISHHKDHGLSMHIDTVVCKFR